MRCRPATFIGIVVAGILGQAGYAENAGPTTATTTAPTTTTATSAESYRAAAEQGDADAQCNLGQCYAEGVGVDKDPAEAVKWFRKAAEQRDAVAKVKKWLTEGELSL